uniref:Centrosomal protein 85 like n=1 Tax=Callorhinchus milii TaxID=7868 RepID=A0A4W3HAI9_CALMI|eukprot:gi/632963377/ref/XP_007897846.1/ PREDICTED: centrosomal protein of 85 kDa-like isoform X2 [Callorhinchus milii]
MWGRVVSDYKSGFMSCSRRAGPDVPPAGWVPGSEAMWRSPTLSASGRSNASRRFSATSDSGDTGIGSSSSGSIEDHSSSSGTSSFKPIKSQIIIPTAHVMPSTSSPMTHRKQDRPDCTKWNTSSTLPGQPRDTSLDMIDPRSIRKWSSLTKLSGSGNCQKDCGSGGKEDSLTNVKSVTNDNVKPCGYGVNDLDNLTYHKTEHLRTCGDAKSWATCTKEPGQSQTSVSTGQYKYENFSRDGGDTRPFTVTPRKNALDLTLSALCETKPTPSDQEVYKQRYSFMPLEHQQAVSGMPIQPSLRTQMWLSDQMQTNSLDYTSTEGSCVFAPWQKKQQLEHLKQEVEQMQILNEGPRQVSMVYPTQLHQDSNQWDSSVKIKECLLRQKDTVIDRHRQQIFQLEQKIRENEFRAQRALLERHPHCDPAFMVRLQHGSLCEKVSKPTPLAEASKAIESEKEDLDQKLSAAAFEVAQLNESLKKNTQKYAEDIKKLEEKMRAREKYISGLKKKWQKESEERQERQQRIETLEKYLADLPTLDDFQSQSLQIKILEDKNLQYEDTIKALENKLGENRVLYREKEILLESQKKKEEELITTVQSLQQKVENCLEDGVRLPMMNIKQLQCQNDQLRESCEAANKVIDNQQQQIETCNLQIQALEKRLRQETSSSQALMEELAKTKINVKLEEEFSSKKQSLPEENSTSGKQPWQADESKQSSEEKSLAIQNLMKDMSYCLYDLRALCNILIERAQGKEPNLSLLLGIRSLHCSGDEGENYHSRELLSKQLSDVCQLRKDIDELRTIISDRYAQDMGDNCITQ